MLMWGLNLDIQDSINHSLSSVVNRRKVAVTDAF